MIAKSKADVMERLEEEEVMAVSRLELVTKYVLMNMLDNLKEQVLQKSSLKIGSIEKRYNSGWIGPGEAEVIYRKNS